MDDTNEYRTIEIGRVSMSVLFDGISFSMPSINIDFGTMSVFIDNMYWVFENELIDKIEDWLISNSIDDYNVVVGLIPEIAILDGTSQRTTLVNLYTLYKMASYKGWLVKSYREYKEGKKNV